MPSPKRVVRIAHAYGNSRPSLARALAADCDMIEADIWYRGGDIFVHHERRLGSLPILYDRDLRGHALGPFAFHIGRYFVRPDIRTLRLDELLSTVAGRKRLLLDVKGHYDTPTLDGYVETLVRQIRASHAESWVAICGQTYSILHPLRETAPAIEVRYSIEQPYQWERFLSLLDGGARQVCMAYGFLDPGKARLMEERGVDVYCWTVDDWDAARRLVSEGVDGIISNDLGLLAQLRNWAVDQHLSS
jgi:Glycerophosphoryl diester phosphodiesterase